MPNLPGSCSAFFGKNPSSFYTHFAKLLNLAFPTPLVTIR
ncbi:hypothetical protein S1OALGB6SA_2066 [Olavius algarvensis spirochete endosymbiont]|nr:hypothetical protein S1OALGB6SA_2066 [Olavius algarvensis spirochete endosymbiont]